MLSIASFGRLFSSGHEGDDYSFDRWLFQPGMAYGDVGFWWPMSQEKRPRPHEGIDFFCYEDRRGRRHSLTLRSVPAPCGGEVIGLCPDFLGHSVFLRPDHSADQGGVYILAHISPQVSVGQIMKQGDVVGRVAAARGETPAHLHVSFLLGDWRDLPGELNWPGLLGQEKLRFVRPFVE